MRFFVDVGGESIAVEVQRHPSGGYVLRDVNGRELTAEVIALRAGSLTLRISGRLVEVQLTDGEVRFAGGRFAARAQSELERASAGPGGADERVAKELRAPMPGRIVRVSCAAGVQVLKGTPLIAIEAMKMQNELKAPKKGKISRLNVAEGAAVEAGQALAEVE